MTAVQEYSLQNGEPFANALNALPGGGIIHLPGLPITEYPCKVKVQNRKYTEASPLIIDGHGETVSLQPMDLSDCSWVTVKGVTCYGGLGLNSSTQIYNDVLQHIRIEGCVFRYGRIFAGGYSYHHITVDKCEVSEICYSGNETHGIYFSGGHWPAVSHMPHPHDITVSNSKFRVCGGRHSIQVNGCFDRVNILDNDSAGSALTFYQGIGVNRCLVKGNTMLLGNRGGINIYDYDDQLPYMPDPGYLEAWRKVHHPNNNWIIRNNTILVGPGVWYDWQNASQVKDRPCILLNNELAGLVVTCSDGSEVDLNYEPTIHHIHSNVLVSPWPNIIEFHDPWSVAATWCWINNISTKHPSLPPLVTAAPDVFDPPVLAATFEQMHEFFGTKWDSNETSMPIAFDEWPTFPPVELIPPINYKYPPEASYDWSKWPVSYDLYSHSSALEGCGAYLPRKKPAIWTRTRGKVPVNKPNPLGTGMVGIEGYKPNLTKLGPEDKS